MLHHSMGFGILFSRRLAVCKPRDMEAGERSSRLLVRRIVLPGIVFGLLVLVCWQQAAAAWQLTEEQRRRDFDVLSAFIEANYPFFHVKERLTGQDWSAMAEELRGDAVHAATPGEFYRAVQRLMMALDNGHSNVIAPQQLLDNASGYDSRRIFGHPLDEDVVRSNQWWAEQLQNGRWPSFQTRYVNGAYHVVWVHPEVAAQVPLGLQIERIDGRCVHDYVQEAVWRGTSRWDYVRERWYVRQLPVAGATVVQLRGYLGGEPVTVTVPTTVDTAVADPELPNLQTTMLSDTTAYVRIRSFNARHLANDAPQLRAFLAAAAEASHLIVAHLS